MQAGPADDRAGQLDRLQVGHRRDGAGLADLHADVADASGRFVFLELVGHDPARALGRAAQPLTLVEAVDFEHQPIHLEVELVQPLHQFLAMSDGRFERGKALDVRRGHQAVSAEFGEKVHVVVGLQPSDVAHAVAKQPQVTRCADSRIKQADAAGGAVAGIGVGRLATLALLLVEPHEIGVGHVDFAPHFQRLRKILAGQS